MPFIISVVARKGGVGKTAIASAVSSVLAAQGKSVLLIDMDTQSSAAVALGANPLGEGTYEWLMGNAPCYQEAQPGLHLLAGGSGLDGIDAQADAVAEVIATTGHDYVVIDTPASATSLSRAAVRASSHVLIATEPHPLGISGACAMVQAIRPDQFSAIVLSRLDLRRSLHRTIAEQATSAFSPIEVMQFRHDGFLERAMAEGRPAALGRRSKAIEDIHAIANKLINTQTQDAEHA